MEKCFLAVNCENNFRCGWTAESIQMPGTIVFFSTHIMNKTTVFGLLGCLSSPFAAVSADVMWAPGGIELGSATTASDRPLLRGGASAGDLSFILTTKYADFKIDPYELKLQTKTPRDPSRPVYNGMAYADSGYGGGIYRNGIFTTSSLWDEDYHGTGLMGTFGVNDAAQLLTSVASAGNGQVLELGNYSAIGAPPGTFAFWGTTAAADKAFIRLTLPTPANSWSAFRLGGSLTVYDTDDLETGATAANERFKLSINPAANGADSLTLKGLAVTIDGARVVTSSGAGLLTVGPLSTSLAGSVSVGNQTISSGQGAVALGQYTAATNYGAFAAGAATKATGYIATALGEQTTASNHHSFASGVGTTASGPQSVAMGRGSVASGYTSFAGGNYSQAGEQAFAFGEQVKATGVQSTAMGSFSRAEGWASTSLGAGNVAAGNGSFAAGYTALPGWRARWRWAGPVAPIPRALSP